MKRLGLAGTALVPASTLLTGRTVARAAGFGGVLSRGDVAILKFLAAIEILESDLWQQYNELALGNESYQLSKGVRQPRSPFSRMTDYSSAKARPFSTSSTNWRKTPTPRIAPIKDSQGERPQIRA